MGLAVVYDVNFEEGKYIIQQSSEKLELACLQTSLQSW
jgi:hypothetical protein